MIAGYLRVSTAQQETAAQRSAIERAAQLRGEVVDAWHAETVSGASHARPVLGKLLEAVRRGQVRRLYVFRVDRLTRRGAGPLLELVELLRRGGCELVSASDGFDFRWGPTTDIVLAVLGYLAQQEREALIDRLQAARAKMSSEGRAWGRPRRELSRETQRLIVELGPTMSTRQLAKRLKLPRSTIGRILGRQGGPKTPPSQVNGPQPNPAAKKK